jgi:hypothetical protein
MEERERLSTRPRLQVDLTAGSLDIASVPGTWYLVPGTSCTLPYLDGI